MRLFSARRPRYCSRTAQGARIVDQLGPEDADLFPMIVSLMQRGNRWLSDTGRPAELRHRGCGAVVHAELRCEHGHTVELAGLDLAATT